MFSWCIYTLYLDCIHALPKWEGYLSTPSPLSSASSSFWSLYFNLKSTFECISVGLPAFACISLIWLGRDTQLGSTGQKLSRSVLEGNDDHFDEGDEEDGDGDVNDDGDDLDDDDDDNDTRLN